MACPPTVGREAFFSLIFRDPSPLFRASGTLKDIPSSRGNSPLLPFLYFASFFFRRTEVM